MDRWDDIRWFLEVSRAGSFTAAARTLDVEQSTVSRRIAQLERALGARLFDRAPSGLLKTCLAERLLARAEGIEALIHGFIDEAAAADRDVSGPVRIAVNETLARFVLIPRALPALLKAHPKIRPELVVSERATDLLHREADIAVRFFRPPVGDLIAKRVARFSTAVLARRDLVAGREKSPSPASLPWIGVTLPGIETAEDAWLRQHVPAAPQLVTDSYAAQIDMVLAGLGVALLSRPLLHVHPELCELALGLPEGPRLELWLVTHAAIRDLPRVRRCFEVLEDALAPLDEA